MATAAAADHLAVVHSIGGHRCPGRGRLVMTGITLTGTADMQSGFTTGTAAVMTTDAIAGEGSVINHRRQPGRGGMTHITLIAGGNVGGGLTRRFNVIVATGTRTSDLAMVHG